MRDLLQVEEGVRRPHPETPLPEARRLQRKAKVQEGDGGFEQGDIPKC